MNRTAKRTVLTLALLALASLAGCGQSWSENCSMEPNHMQTCNVPSAHCMNVTVVPAH